MVFFILFRSDERCRRCAVPLNRYRRPHLELFRPTSARLENNPGNKTHKSVKKRNRSSPRKTGFVTRAASEPARCSVAAGCGGVSLVLHFRFRLFVGLCVRACVRALVRVCVCLCVKFWTTCFGGPSPLTLLFFGKLCHFPSSPSF